ncbi:MAG: nucleotidyltransferase domain-containing protein [Anaerolineae bacterium]|nr:nucleotidyltransferase domain-containing protein [Anaerolineae bacterium]
MITSFDPTILPDLPQSQRLAALVADLWADPNVVALWLGGSLARGEADRYSDVDLHVALLPEAYDPEAIPESAGKLATAAVVRLRFSFGPGTTLWHMLLEDGEIYDLSLQPTTQEPAFEARLVLACRDEAFGAKLIGGADRSVDFPPAVPEDIARAIAFYWINQQKGQKVLHRGMPLLAWQGEYLMRQDLIRFWYILATGNDCGPLHRLTIHTLTPVIRAVQAEYGADALALVGQPLRTEAEIIAEAADLREEIARIGRVLAEKFDFAYPSTAEATVRRTWQEFLAAHPVARAE